MSDTDCTLCGNPLATEALGAHESGCECAECRAHCWSEYGGDCPPEAPTPPPLDAALESLRAMSEPGHPALIWIRADGGVSIVEGPGAAVTRAHLHGADGLPTPSAALAALRGGK